MNLEMLMQLIQQYGYLALFFALWLGIVGMPIPDEVVVMTGGLVASFHILHPIPAFIVTYLGVVSGLSLGYVLGSRVGAPILNRINRRGHISKYIEKSQQLLNRYGSYTIIISYFLPVVRHVVPYLVGINKMSYARYALFSYTTGLVWTILFFVLGYFFGKHINDIADSVIKYGWYALLAGVLLLGLMWLRKAYR